jgi:surfeit locus 1 family protein
MTPVEQARLSRRAMLIAAVCAFAGIVVLLSLARWQATRATWKEALIADLSLRLAAPPVDVPAPDAWRDLDANAAEFVRVSFLAELVPGEEALVYTSGSSLRPDVKGAGYWVLALARLSGGGLVVLNRGFVPEGRQDAKARAAGQQSGVARIVGVMRWPEAHGVFTPNDDPVRNLWFVRDHIAIAKEKGWGAVAPFYIELEAPSEPGGLPQVGTLVANLPNNHRQYELTWALLAVVLAGVFGTFFWRWYRTGVIANRGCPGGPNSL